jgi:hypothetical protein
MGVYWEGAVDILLVSCRYLHFMLPCEVYVLLLPLYLFYSTMRYPSNLRDSFRSYPRVKP